MWWLLFAVLIVLVWAGWYIFAFTKDRERSRDTANNLERLDVDPQGPTSIPREQQGHEPEEGTGRRPLE